MSSVKSRVAVAGGKYLITHPRGRITRFVVRFAVRKLSKRVATATRYEALPEVRGSRLTTLAGIATVAGGIVFVVRRTAKSTSSPSSPVVVPPANAPFPAAAGGAAPPETHDAPSTTPTASLAAEAAALTLADGDDEAIVARVEDKLFGGTPPLGVTVEAQSGVVTLRGTVADEESEVRFVHDAEQIPGVKAVQSELQTAGAEPGAPS